MKRSENTWELATAPCGTRWFWHQPHCTHRDTDAVTTAAGQRQAIRPDPQGGRGRRLRARTVFRKLFWVSLDSIGVQVPDSQPAWPWTMTQESGQRAQRVWEGKSSGLHPLSELFMMLLSPSSHSNIWPLKQQFWSPMSSESLSCRGGTHP